MVAELTWHSAGKAEEIKANEPRQLRLDNLVVAVFKVGDEFFAIDDICTHQFAFLSEGYQEGDVIECPLHQAQFHIPSGKCLSPPAECDTRVFPVRIDGGDVYVGIASESS